MILYEELNKNILKDFPGGTVDKNLPANAGDMGLIQLSPCTTSTEPEL